MRVPNLYKLKIDYFIITWCFKSKFLGLRTFLKGI